MPHPKDEACFVSDQSNFLATTFENFTAIREFHRRKKKISLLIHFLQISLDKMDF